MLRVNHASTKMGACLVVAYPGRRQIDNSRLKGAKNYVQRLLTTLVPQRIRWWRPGVTALAGVCSGPLVLAQQARDDKTALGAGSDRCGAGMGGYSVGCALTERQLVALVDVDEKNIAQVMKDRRPRTRPGPRSFMTIARMLDECHNGPGRGSDRLPPDHPPCPGGDPAAINYGKHVFCQKPLAHNIAECYALAKAAKEKKVLTQMGNQGYCGEAIPPRCRGTSPPGPSGRSRKVHSAGGAANFGGSGGRPPSQAHPGRIALE